MLNLITRNFCDESDFLFIFPHCDLVVNMLSDGCFDNSQDDDNEMDENKVCVAKKCIGLMVHNMKI